MKLLRTVLIFWLPLIAWLLVIHNFSATPADALPAMRIPYADKVAHIVVYFVLGVLTVRAFDKSDLHVSLEKTAFLAIMIALSYGALDEWHQRSVPGRSCDLFDFFADCAGSCAGILLYMADTKERRG